MSKKIATMMMAAIMAVATAIPPAQADPGRGRHFNGNSHQAYNGGHHRGHGHWHNGQWIVLGILGAAAAAAVANSDNGDCYYRQGHRYCE